VETFLTSLPHFFNSSSLTSLKLEKLAEMIQSLVRTVSRSLAQCELVHVERQAFDLALAREQHAAYVAALQTAGAVVTVLPEERDLPDATFVEDTVIVFDELAVLCRPGAKSREPEVARIESAIAKHREMERILDPGILEGGDVLRIGRTVYIGLSSRTNEEGIRQLGQFISKFDYSVVPVRVNGCLHLKTAATSPAEGLLLVNPDWIDVAPFQGLEVLPVPRNEPWGANTLRVNNNVMVADSSPRTAHLLQARGLNIHQLNISELQKAEAGLTCLSVFFQKGARTPLSA
jgi:dimethylargininase